MTDKTFILFMIIILEIKMATQSLEGEPERRQEGRPPPPFGRQPVIEPPQDVDESDDYEHVTPFTDEEIAEVQNEYIGDFSTMKFDYFNNQFLYSYHQRVNDRSAQCFDEYFRCMANLVHPVMVCAVNEYRSVYYKANWISYCDFFLENCRRQTRVFYLVGPGVCDRGESGMLIEAIKVKKPDSAKFSHPYNTRLL